MERNSSNPNKKIEPKRKIPNYWFSPTEGPQRSCAYSSEFIEKFGGEIVEDIINKDEESVKKKTGFSIAELKAKIKELEREWKK